MTYLTTQRKQQCAYPKIIIPIQIDAAPSGYGRALIHPRPLQGTGLPDADQTPRVEAEVDAIRRPLDDGRVVGPTVAGTTTWICVSRDPRGERRRRGQ